MRRLLPLLLFACATIPYVGPSPAEVDAERAVCALYRLQFVPKVRFVAQSISGADGLAEGESIIVRRAPGQALHTTAFAHELFHHAVARRGGWGDDPYHQAPGWEGQPNSEVDAANRMLLTRGE